MFALEEVSKTLNLPTHVLLDVLGEDVLWVEVAALAIDDFLIPADPKAWKTAEFLRAAERGTAFTFIFSEDEDDFNLGTICSSLGLSTGQVRGVLVNMAVETATRPHWSRRRDRRFEEFLRRVIESLGEEYA